MSTNPILTRSLAFSSSLLLRAGGRQTLTQPERPSLPLPPPRRRRRAPPGEARSGLAAAGLLSPPFLVVSAGWRRRTAATCWRWARRRGVRGWRRSSSVPLQRGGRRGSVAPAAESGSARSGCRRPARFGREVSRGESWRRRLDRGYSGKGWRGIAAWWWWHPWHCSAAGGIYRADLGPDLGLIRGRSRPDGTCLRRPVGGRRLWRWRGATLPKWM